jgi:hypothetical protein
VSVIDERSACVASTRKSTWMSSRNRPATDRAGPPFAPEIRLKMSEANEPPARPRVRPSEFCSPWIGLNESPFPLPGAKTAWLMTSSGVSWPSPLRSYCPP